MRIPKSNGKLRSLGIPTMKDRAMQALYLLALDPVAETTADRNSYVFRPHRSCANAIEQGQETGWDIHHIVRKTQGGSDNLDNLVMLHPNCYRQLNHSSETGSQHRGLINA